MADIFTKKKRSEIMSKVKNKDSKIEIEFRKKTLARRVSLSQEFYKILRQTGHRVAEIQNRHLY